MTVLRILLTVIVLYWGGRVLCHILNMSSEGYYAVGFFFAALAIFISVEPYIRRHNNE